MRSVPHRVAVLMQGSCQLEPDDRCHARREVDGERARISLFGALDPGWADTNPPGYFADTEASRQPRRGELIGKSIPEEPTALGSERRDALAACHCRSLIRSDSRSLIRD